MKTVLLALLLAAGTATAHDTLYAGLSGEWRQSPDDRPQYADPAFDDADWQTTRLPYTSFHLQSLAVYWLRKTVDLPQDVDSSSAVLTIGPLREVYEVYWNGQRIGETGPFLDDSRAQIARTRMFPVPPAVLKGRTRVCIALRTRGVYYGSTTSRIFLGGSYLLSDAARAPVGEAKAMTESQRLTYSPRMLLSGLMLCLSLLTFILWLGERDREELLWIAALTASRGVNDALLFSHVSLASFPLGQFHWLYLASGAGIFIALLELALTIAGWRDFRLRAGLWIMAVVTTFAGLAGLGALCADTAALLIVAVGWWRRGRFHQPSARTLTALVIALLAIVQVQALGGLKLIGIEVYLFPIFYSAGAMMVSVQSTIFIVLGGILFLLSLGRLIGDRVEKQRLSGELEAARVVQQLLLESKTNVNPSFDPNQSWAIEACYLPAAEVGGDFYQIFPLEDGGNLIAAGDVSGKGLKAAMVVSLITGALRNRHSDGPADLLAELNRVLTGSLGGGFVTAAIARLYPGGRVVAANAGHPSPYCNGEEITLDSGLPLGLTGASEYSSREFHLEPGQLLTFVSDGVIEAENTRRELFGFDRTREISGKPAREIAAAAQAWGQNDDITVVTIRRNA